MVSLAAVRTVLVALIVVGALGATASTATYAQFSDAHGGTGSASAASSFGGNGGGGGSSLDRAYDDANGNGRYDEGETTYGKNELRSFENRSVDLVIPAGVGEVKDNRGLSVTAGSIASSVDLRSKRGDVALSAVDGGIDLSGATVRSGAGTVDVEASGDATLDGASVTADGGPISVSAGGRLSAYDATVEARGNATAVGRTVSMRRASVRSAGGRTVAAASRNGGGTLDATDAALVGGDGGVALGSNGDLRLNGSTLRSQRGQAAADLGTDAATLFVDGTDVDDADGTLAYDPDGVTVVGSARNQTSP